VARQGVNRPHGKNSSHDWIKAEAVPGSRRPALDAVAPLACLILVPAAVAADDECLLDEAIQMLAADRSRVLLGARRRTARDAYEKDHCERDKSSLDHGLGRAARPARAALLSASMTDFLTFIYRAGSGRVAATGRAAACAAGAACGVPYP